MQLGFPRSFRPLRNVFVRPIPLKSYLTRLMIGVLGPLLLFAILMVVLFAGHEKGVRQRELESAARSLALAVDQEIRSSITKLEAFATLEALDTGSVGVFQEAAERFVQTQKNWRALTLSDPRGAPLATVSGGSRGAPIPRETIQELLQTRQPVVTAFAPGESGDGVRVHVPVVREQTIIYVLSAAVEPWAFTKILAQQKIPADWIGTLYNGRRITIARSREAKQWIGKPVGSLLHRTHALPGEQFFRGQTANGRSAYAAVSRSPLTGWFLALTVPSAEIDSLLYGSIALVGGGGLFLLLAGLGVGLLFARRASHSMAALSAAAHALGRGAPVPLPGSSPIAELDSLAAEMTRAGHLLRERERDRDRVEAALRRSEENLRTQAQELEQQLLASGRLVAVGELTASMAHEFNNPLGIILGFAQGLLESMGPDHPDYGQVRIIADEAKRCERLVQELLEFGRPKNAEFIPVEVPELIQRTTQLVQPRAAKNRVETTVQVADALPPLLADPQQLQQLLLNLSLNAVDAMPKGGRLTLEARRHGADAIVLSVEDTGMGIDADLLPKIFQPFITSKKRRGLGLGLPICDRIVKAHGGEVRVRSRIGEGTVFDVMLPLRPPAAAAPANETPGAPSAHL